MTHDTETAVAITKLGGSIDTMKEVVSNVKTSMSNLQEAVEVHAEEQRSQTSRIESIERAQAETTTAINRLSELMENSVKKRLDSLEGAENDRTAAKKAAQELDEKNLQDVKRFRSRVLFVVRVAGGSVTFLAGLGAWFGYLAPLFK